MLIQDSISLSNYSTMRLGGSAAHLVEVTTDSELKEAWQWAQERQLPVLVIGQGSNIIWRDEGFPGLVIVNRILGYELRPFDEQTAVLTLGAGEPWDAVVAKTVEAGYYTLAPLSLIPGTSGATPIQNVGAYGQEISNSLMTLQALDTTTGKFIILRGSDCAFAYRSSRFKTTDRGKYLITSITLSLSKLAPTRPYYEAVERYLREHQQDITTPQAMRDVVIAIRQSKLPDPAVVANNGSFFANPIINDEQLAQVLGVDESAKYWHLDGGKVKLSAAWLLEKAGFKGYHDQETGMTTWDAQPLVLVNEHAKSTADLLKFKQRIVDVVRTKFGITLEQEPELLP